MLWATMTLRDLLLGVQPDPVRLSFSVHGTQCASNKAWKLVIPESSDPVIAVVARAPGGKLIFVTAAMTVRESGRDAVMVNCNPETVSTDYDTSDRLYFEPLTAEDVLAVVDIERRISEKEGQIHRHNVG